MKQKTDKLFEQLKPLIAGDFNADFLNKAAFSTDASIYQFIPQAIIAPKSSSDIITVVRFAAEHNIHVVPRGAASGVAGESLTSGIVLDMTRYMNRILSCSDDGQIVTCQPGVVLDELNEYLAPMGRKIGPDPSSSNRATVGGCVANNATGAHSLQYGYIADYVHSVDAVLADGSAVTFTNDYRPADSKIDDAVIIPCLKLLTENESVIRQAMPETLRNRSGYNVSGICRDGRINMAQLMAGSEATLAIFTSITLKTVSLPKVKALAQFEFESFEKMAKAVPIIVESDVSACELMDRKLMNLACQASALNKEVLPFNAQVSLLIEHIGNSRSEVEAKIANSLKRVGGLSSGAKSYFDEKDQKRAWKARKDAVPLLSREKGRKHPIPFIEDVSVSNTRLAEYIAGLEKIGKKYSIDMAFYGHAGDGELHIRPYMDLSDPEDIERMRQIADEVFALAWSLGGSISGEHADGLVRAAYVEKQYGRDFYTVLKQIKNIFDPAGILNPGKIINSDPDVMVKNLRAEYRFLDKRLQSSLYMENEELRNEIDQCSGCGLCLTRQSDLRMCPVYRAMGTELGVPRAKANILRFWATGQIDEKEFESARFREFLNLCINCKTCSLQCPSGVDISKIMIAARAEMAKRKPLSIGKTILVYNRFMAAANGMCAPVANFVMALKPVRWCMEKFLGFEYARKMPAFEQGSFISKGRKYLKKLPAIPNPVDKVAYFVDTYANYNDHSIGFAVIDVLRHNNIEVVIPDQRPAPLPGIVYGKVNPARRELTYNVTKLAEWVKKGYKIVCSEPSAALCLQQELRHFVDSEDARLVSQNTSELMNYLLSFHQSHGLKPASKHIEGSFAYHTPCHLLACGQANASGKILADVCGINLIDLKAGCCGMAGTFAMQKKNYLLSSQISGSLDKAIKNTKASNILTECGACTMQIQHISDSKVNHPVKLLAKAYNMAK